MNQTELVVEQFQGFRMPALPIDEFESKGKQVLMDKMQPFISRNEPIKFTMLGYPMKSPNNRDKVLGDMPDYAEEVSLLNFGNFNEAIKKVYAPGIQISIISDGLVFSDLMGISDTTVDRYGEINRDITKQLPVQWFDLKDFYSDASVNTMRDKVMSQFGITPEELERRILIDPDVHSLYLGMIRFMNLDIAIRDFPSKNKLQQEAKRLAREMMLRNEAYSALIRTEFSDHVRLSMHPSVNNGTKFSYQLIPSTKAWTSPWHCALAIDKDGDFVTIHKKDAIAQGMELVYKDNKPYYFTA